MTLGAIHAPDIPPPLDTTARKYICFQSQVGRDLCDRHLSDAGCSCMATLARAKCTEFLG
jgi:hypothetical protein